MAKIMVDIHCNTESCRECRFEKENYSRGKALCGIFLKLLEYDQEGSCYRLPECIVAEVNDKESKETIVKYTCGKCVHNKTTPCKPYYCGHDFVDGRRPKAVLKRKGECPAWGNKLDGDG